MEGVSRARPEAARGTERSEYRTGEDVGEAEPLMPLERPKPLVWGAVKEAKRPAACIPDDRGRLAPLAGEGRGGVVRRVKFVHPLKVRRFFGFQDRFSASNPQTSPKARRAVFPACPALGCALTLKSASFGLCALL